MVRSVRSLLLGACVLLLARSHPAVDAFYVGGENHVVQFGTYEATQKECFFGKIFSAMASPQTMSFSNPAATAIAFISVVTEPGIELGGISASITSGTIGTSTTITMQVSTAPISSQFLQNVNVRMFCKP